jgi:hypothetical protein
VFISGTYIKHFRSFGLGDDDGTFRDQGDLLDC